MQIKIDENNLIQSYSMIGNIDGGIEVEQSLIPNNFEIDFVPEFYKFTNGGIVVNGDYVEPISPIETPTAEQQALTALAQQIADNDTENKTQLTSIEQALTALATGGNA